MEDKAIVEFVKKAMPSLSEEFAKEHPGVAKAMLKCLYYAPNAPVSVRAKLDPDKTSDKLKIRADRMLSMETGNYVNMSLETQERFRNGK